MITILVQGTDPDEASGYYRGLDIFGHLRSMRQDLNIAFMPNVNRAFLSLIDLVYIQRPSTDSQRELVRLAKSKGKPVWVDYDDDLFNIPTDNPAKQVYGEKELHNIRMICAGADVITVSTKGLAISLLQYLLNPKEIQIIRNAVNFEEPIFNSRNDAVNENYHRPYEISNPYGNGLKTILWRGSATHQRDMATYMNQIVAVHQKYPDWKWVFFGWNPWFITDNFAPESFEVVTAKYFLDYLYQIQKIGAAIQIVPLADNVFNHSKSNIAWLEGSFAGSICLVPKWTEWVNPGVVTYDSPENFQESLEYLITSIDKHGSKMVSEMSDTSWDLITKSFNLNKANAIRSEIIDKLTRRS